MKLPENSRKNANILSKLLFCWMLPLFRRGLKRDLVTEDLGKPLDSDLSQMLGDKLEKNWIIEVARCKKLGKTPSLLRALVKTFIVYYLIDGLMVFIQYIGCKTFQPLLLAMLLKRLKSDGTWDDQTAAAQLAGGVVALSVGSVFLQHHTAFHQQQLGMRLRIACCSLLYRKILRLNTGSLNQITAGQVINLMSNDVNRFDSVLKFLHVIWVIPIQITLSFYLYSQKVSSMTFLGIIFIILQTFPLQSYISKLTGKFRLLIAKRTDERVRMMDEIICGIQVIKMYAWEKPFEKAVTLARKNEMKFLKRVSYLKAVNASFFIFTERTSLYVTLLAHVLFNHPVNASTVYSLSQFYNLLQTMLAFVYPNAITSSAECLVSVKRIQEFLILEEKDPMISIKDHVPIQKPRKIGSLKINSDFMFKPGSLGNSVPEEGIFNTSYEGEDKKTEGERKSHISLNPTETPAIEIKNVTASWNSGIEDNQATLRDISMIIPRGKLCAIIGSIGAGKSTFLQLVLNEITPNKGHVNVYGSVSYACQEPWLFVSTVRENILFGLPYDHKKYREIVRVCALEKDFQQLPRGDQTLVGERGVSLSGGQKARINLARAVYRKADIYLLDDPLSGLDVPVGSHIFQECFSHYLHGTTRVIVTHQLQYLKAADHIIILNNGRIENKGSFDKLVNSGQDFTGFISPHHKPPPGEDINDTAYLPTNSIREISRRISVASTAKSEYEEEETTAQEQEKEEKVSGRMRCNVYWKYWGAGKRPVLLFAMIATVIFSHIMASCCDYWVTYWTNQHSINSTTNIVIEDIYLTAADGNIEVAYGILNYDDNKTSSLLFKNNSHFQNHLIDETQPSTEKMSSLSDALRKIIGPLESLDYVYVYSVLIGLCVFSSILGCVLFFVACMNSSQGLHNQIFNAIIKAPMRFFDVNPSGRILNRFSKDLGTIDEMLPKDMLEAVQIILFMLSALIMVTITSSWLLAPTAILILLFFLLLFVYLRTAQDIKRLEGITRSPVFSHTSATIKGMSTIRSANSQNRLAKEFDQCQDIHTASWYQFLASRVTLGFWLDITGIMFVACVTFSFIFYNNGMSRSGDIGLAISQSLMLTATLQFGVRQLTEVVSHLTSVERMLQYSNLGKENGNENKSDSTPKNWPSAGTIAFKHVSLKYSEKDKPVLEDFNIRIKSGWKIGIVGRTGAGKSSLIAALFRLAKVQGTIVIDELETDKISLHDLRSKISIIPQEPILFSTSIRRNLDPFEIYDDVTLWNALESVYLKDIIPSLDHHVSEGGSNFSLGQRQLVCLARAILKNNQILVLDEATANMDPQTDNFIQQIIREKFSQCTVITIAHRLNTIMDADRVLVMDGGKNIEFNHPYLLLQDPDSILSSMVKDTGSNMANALRILAKETYLGRIQERTKENRLSNVRGHQWKDDESISYGSMSDEYES